MVSDAPSRTYAGQSAADRRAERRERLMAAGLDLLGTEGSAGTTVRAVCGRAKLTPRYFYESFDDLDALLIAVLDDVVTDATATILRAVDAAPHDAHAKAHAAIETFVGFLSDDPRRARVCFVESLSNERLARRRRDLQRGMTALVAAQGREFYGVQADTDPMADIAAELLVGGMAELLMSWLNGDLHVTRAQLVADMSELFVATGETAAAIAARRSTKETR
jgi:AcrR family transcriptional regulator